MSAGRGARVGCVGCARCLGPHPAARTTAIVTRSADGLAVDMRGLHSVVPLRLDADGDVTVLELQPENKRRMSAAEFINGYQPKPGQFFS